MITPKEIETKEFKKVALGYSPEEVDEFLDELTIDYQKIYTQSIEMQDKVHLMNENMDHYRSMEKTIQNTLILAEKAAEEAKEAAQLRAKQIEEEAKIQAEEILREAKSQLFKVEQEIDRLQSQYELMRTRVKLLLYAEIELIDKNEILAEKKAELEEKEEK